jgi:hypothetical protein
MLKSSLTYPGRRCGEHEQRTHDDKQAWRSHRVDCRIRDGLLQFQTILSKAAVSGRIVHVYVLYFGEADFQINYSEYLESTRLYIFRIIFCLMVVKYADNPTLPWTHLFIFLQFHNCPSKKLLGYPGCCLFRIL